MRNHAFFDHRKPIAMAHRGDHRHFTENTLEAFDEAIQLGFVYMESDVHATSDGIAVLSHDADLQRIANRPERIAELSWSQLSTISLPCGSRIARLDQALSDFPTIRFNLDAKAPEAVDPMAVAIKATEATDRTCIGSFSHRRVARLRVLLPHSAHSASPMEVLSLKLGRRMAADAAMIPMRVGPVPVTTAALIERAHQHQRLVHVWTVNERAEMESLLDLGADGVMTDQPEVLKEVWRNRGLW